MRTTCLVLNERMGLQGRETGTTKCWCCAVVIRPLPPHDPSLPFSTILMMKMNPEQSSSILIEWKEQEIAGREPYRGR